MVGTSAFTVNVKTCYSSVCIDVLYGCLMKYVIATGNDEQQRERRRQRGRVRCTDGSAQKVHARRDGACPDGEESVQGKMIR